MSVEIPSAPLPSYLVELVVHTFLFSKLSTFFHETCFSPFACPSMIVLSFGSHSAF